MDSYDLVGYALIRLTNTIMVILTVLASLKSMQYTDTPALKLLYKTSRKCSGLHAC
jgi:hypothetical protein